MSGKQQQGILQITSVYYEQGHKNGHYGHETIGATTAVDGFESPGQALEALVVWVHEGLGLSERATQLQQSCETLKDEEKTLQEAVSMMRHRYEKSRMFLEKIGLSIPQSWLETEELPF